MTRRRRSEVFVALALACSSCGVAIVGEAAPDGGAVDAAPPPPIDAGRDAPPEGDAPVVRCIPPAPGMIAWWTGDDGMFDSAGDHEGASGTQMGATAVRYAEGKVRRAFDLDGTSYVLVPDHAALANTPAITIEAWIFAKTLGGRIVDKIMAGGANGYLLDTYPKNLRFIIGSQQLISAAILATNTWVHVAATWDGTTGTLFIDGVSSGTKAMSGPMPTSTLDVRIGADSLGNNRFAGKLDEVAVYGRALAAAEIATIVAAGPDGRCRP